MIDDSFGEGCQALRDQFRDKPEQPNDNRLLAKRSD
jgi:hypothetical protein